MGVPAGTSTTGPFPIVVTDDVTGASLTVTGYDESSSLWEAFKNKIDSVDTINLLDDAITYDKLAPVIKDNIDEVTANLLELGPFSSAVDISNAFDAGVAEATPTPGEWFYAYKTSPGGAGNPAEGTIEQIHVWAYLGVFAGIGYSWVKLYDSLIESDNQTILDDLGARTVDGLGSVAKLDSITAAYVDDGIVDYDMLHPDMRLKVDDVDTHAGKLQHITVTEAIDLDTIEFSIAAPLIVTTTRTITSTDFGDTSQLHLDIDSTAGDFTISIDPTGLNGKSIVLNHSKSVTGTPNVVTIDSTNPTSPTFYVMDDDTVYTDITIPELSKHRYKITEPNTFRSEHQVLHDVPGAGGTWGALAVLDEVDLTTDVTGVLPVANFATGTPDGTKFVRDDGALITPPGGGATNLSWTASTSTVASDTGTDAVITVVDGTNPGLASVADKAAIDANTATLANVGSAITTTAANLLDDASVGAMQATLGVDAAGTDNSTDVTLSGTPDYITLAGQVLTRNPIELTTDVSGILPIADGGTNAATAGAARTNLGLAIGSDVQAHTAVLDGMTASFTTALASDISANTAKVTADATSVAAAGAVMESDTTTALMSFVVDEDNMVSDLDTKVPTQQSAKAYVDNAIAGLTALESTDIDTLAEINAILGDATLIRVEDTDTTAFGFVVDEDDLVSDSNTKIPTQQSTKAYVDNIIDSDTRYHIFRDDHASFAAAITAAEALTPAAGETVTIKYGVGVYTDGGTIAAQPKPTINIALIGSGRGHTIIDGEGTTENLLTCEAVNFKARGITFDGFTHYALGVPCLTAGTTELDIQDCEFVNCATSGDITAYSTRYSAINTPSNANIAGTLKNVTIKDNIFEGCKCAVKLRAVETTDLDISGNRINGYVGSYGGIEIGDDPSAPAVGGIFPNRRWRFHGNTITNITNTVAEVAETHALIAVGGAEAIITNNIIDNIKGGVTTGSPDYIGGCEGIYTKVHRHIITGNTFRNAGYSDAALTVKTFGWATDPAHSDLTFLPHEPSLIANNVVEFDADADNNYETRGIHLNKGENTIVAFNIVRGFNEAGISMATAHGAKIYNNTVENNADYTGAGSSIGLYGILVSDSDGVILKNNSISNIHIPVTEAGNAVGMYVDSDAIVEGNVIDTVTNDNVTNSAWCMTLGVSDGLTIRNNIFKNAARGIRAYDTIDNYSEFGNIFVNCTLNLHLVYTNVNTWQADPFKDTDADKMASKGIKNITQANYDALSPPDPDTIYMIPKV